jgi:hypothetical protein
VDDQCNAGVGGHAAVQVRRVQRPLAASTISFLPLDYWSQFRQAPARSDSTLKKPGTSIGYIFILLLSRA